MFSKITSRFFGSANDRQIKKYKPKIDIINKLEKNFESLSDNDLKLKTVEFKKRLSDKETVISVLPEAFAVVREAAKRTLNQRHFDVQLMGGLVLHVYHVSRSC